MWSLLGQDPSSTSLTPVSTHTTTPPHSYPRRLLTLALLPNGASVGPLLWGFLTKWQDLAKCSFFPFAPSGVATPDKHLTACPV